MQRGSLIIRACRQGQLAVQLAWFNWAMGARQPKSRVLMDYTGQGQISLWAALASRGRSVPMLCQVMPKQCEHEMILELKKRFRDLPSFQRSSPATPFTVDDFVRQALYDYGEIERLMPWSVVD